MLGPSESLKTVLETDRVCDGGQVEGDVPERVDGGGDALADLAHHVALQLASEDGVHDARALRRLDVCPVNNDKYTVRKERQRNQQGFDLYDLGHFKFDILTIEFF